jgi:CDP-diglyceride synthetase
MAWLTNLLPMVIFAILVLVIYNLIKPYLLSKVKINKWVLLGIAILSLFLPNVIMAAANINPQNNQFLIWIPSGVFIIFFLWFMDISGFGAKRNRNNTTTTTSYNNKNNKKDVVIRPKAKPNRVKNKEQE